MSDVVKCYLAWCGVLAVAIGGAAVVAGSGEQGWGWLVFIACLLLFAQPSLTSRKDGEE